MKNTKGKKCTKCKQELPLEMFWFNIKKKGYRKTVCIPCNRGKKSYWKEKYRIKKRLRDLRYVKTTRKQRRAVDSKYRLDSNVGSLMGYSLRGAKAGRKWCLLVGYSIEDLMEHLEKQFDDKMTWENYGSYWHVDHIKPRSLFKYTTPEEQEFIDCWSLNNLQPLEKMENIRKSNKFPFARE
jgi:5-methylcytosine-specific restriction endonuclease McrA